MKPEIQKLIDENEEIVEKNLYRWIIGFKKKKQTFTIPTDQEIMDYFLESGFRCNQEIIKRIREVYEGKMEGKWIDTYGREIINWKGKLHKVWFKYGIPVPKSNQSKVDKF